jgi:hypothetical protein
MTNRKYNNHIPKQDKIINLTDSHRRNSTPAIRQMDISVNPVTGTHTYTPTSRRRNPTNPNDMLSDSGSTTTFMIVPEDKGDGLSTSKEQYQPPPTDPEPNADELLEAAGATILDSTTYFPASKQSLSKRSMTPAEHAAERGYYLER